MNLEYPALLQTWDHVPSHPNKTIGQRKWIFRIKYRVDSTLDRYKANLVAKGFQKTQGIDYFDTFSPIVKPTTIHFIFTIEITMNWDI